MLRLVNIYLHWQGVMSHGLPSTSASLWKPEIAQNIIHNKWILLSYSCAVRSSHRSSKAILDDLWSSESSATFHSVHLYIRPEKSLTTTQRRPITQTRRSSRKFCNYAILPWTTPFWVISQSVLVMSYRYFETTYRPHLQVSIIQYFSQFNGWHSSRMPAATIDIEIIREFVFW